MLYWKILLLTEYLCCSGAAEVAKYMGSSTGNTATLHYRPHHYNLRHHRQHNRRLHDHHYFKLFHPRPFSLPWFSSLFPSRFPYILAFALSLSLFSFPFLIPFPFSFLFASLFFFSYPIPHQVRVITTMTSALPFKYHGMWTVSAKRFQQPGCNTHADAIL